jgi:hypothetical protein
LCYDPDDSLVYDLANSTDGVFFRYNINDLTCLEVNLGNVVNSKYCVRFYDHDYCDYCDYKTLLLFILNNLVIRCGMPEFFAILCNNRKANF